MGESPGDNVRTGGCQRLPDSLSETKGQEGSHLLNVGSELRRESKRLNIQ